MISTHSSTGAFFVMKYPRLALHNSRQPFEGRVPAGPSSRSYQAIFAMSPTTLKALSPLSLSCFHEPLNAIRRVRRRWFGGTAFERVPIARRIGVRGAGSSMKPAKVDEMGMRLRLFFKFGGLPLAMNLIRVKAGRSRFAGTIAAGRRIVSRCRVLSTLTSAPRAGTAW